MIKKIMKYIKHPQLILLKLDQFNLIRITDKKYLELMFLSTFNRMIDFSNPKTFNEKLQWLKLYDRKDIYTTMVDKYGAKKYVGDIIGKEYIIPTLGIYDNFNEIDFEKLPDQFVIKCTHDSGSVVIVKDKNQLNIKEVHEKIIKSLKNNFYYNGREWPYKNVKPRILIEEYMEDTTGELRDYKFYSFNGKCDYVMLCFDRMKGSTKFIYFDKNWNIKKEFSNDGLLYGDRIKVEKPKNLKKMFDFAKLLSKNIPFVRVDFYEVNGQLYFGELTFYPSAGFDNTRTKECQKYLDDKLVLDIKEKL